VGALAAGPPQPDHRELAYYVCAGSARLPLVALVRVAGCRWRVEEAFRAGKGLGGLDQHQVRRWSCWYRWVTLAMLAYGFLVVAAVTEHAGIHHRWG
jgi:SRSO17 transposase